MFSKRFPSSEVLYPSDLHEHQNSGSKVVLVEGLADMLRLRRDGIPALCFFGTGNWKYRKIKILYNLGIERVVVCGDGDDAGWKINKIIASDLCKKFNVDIFDIPTRVSAVSNFDKHQLRAYAKKHKFFKEGMTSEDILSILNGKKWDPGNMPAKYVRQLYKLLNK